MDPIAPIPPEECPETTPVKEPKRRRVTNAGLAILDDFLSNVSNNPNAIQRAALLQKIRANPGCEDYQDKNLKTWFQARRKKHSNPVSPSQAGPSDTGSMEHIPPLYPSLNEQSIKHLNIMFQPNQYPSPDIIKTWALLLNATERDVSAWVDAHKAEDSGTEHSFHLPTPSESTSPEPSKTSFPAITQQPPTFKPEPSQSPVISSFSIASTLGRREVPSSMRHPVHKVESEPPSSTELIVRAISDAFSDTANTVSTVHPKTAAEFDTLFAPYKDKMESFIRKVEDGSLRGWGWDPAMIKPLE